VVRWSPRGIGKREHGCNSRRSWISGKVEHVADRATLHSGIRTPGPLRIFVAAAPAIIGRVRIDQHRRRSSLFRDERLHASEILPITHVNDLAPNVHLELLKLVKSLSLAVIVLNDFR